MMSDLQLSDIPEGEKENAVDNLLVSAEVNIHLRSIKALAITLKFIV